MPVTRRDPSHPSHDPYLIAQLAADDLAGGLLQEAERVVARCDRCAGLLADLRDITSATVVQFRGA